MIDWSKAPEEYNWHVYEPDGSGWWYTSKPTLYEYGWNITHSADLDLRSPYKLESGDWRNSLEKRPVSIMNNIIDKLKRKADLHKELLQLEKELSEVNIVEIISDIADSLSVKDSVNDIQTNLGISYEELAEGLGITRKTLYNWIYVKDPALPTKLGLYFLSTLSIQSLMEWKDD